MLVYEWLRKAIIFSSKPEKSRVPALDFLLYDFFKIILVKVKPLAFH